MDVTLHVHPTRACGQLVPRTALESREGTPRLGRIVDRPLTQPARELRANVLILFAVTAALFLDADVRIEHSSFDTMKTITKLKHQAIRER